MDLRYEDGLQLKSLGINCVSHGTAPFQKARPLNSWVFADFTAVFVFLHGEPRRTPPVWGSPKSDAPSLKTIK